MNLGDIVTVMAPSGEYVGKLIADDEKGVTLKDPRLVMMNEKGMGFANGIAATGTKDPKEMTLRQAFFMCETNPDVVSAYRQQVSGLVLPSGAKF